MSNIFQQVIDSIKQIAKDSGQFHPLFAEGDSDTLSVDGYYAQLNENYDEAIQLYSKALKTFPDNIMARNNRAQVYLINKKFDDALADIEYTLRRLPHNDDAIQLRGKIYIQTENYKTAIADFTHLIDQNHQKENLQIYRLRATCGYYVDKIQAIHDYTYIIELEDDEVQLKHDYMNRGYVYFMLDDFDSALSDYLRAVEIDEEYAYGYRRCVDIYVQRKQYKTALETINRTIEIEPENAEYLIQKGNILSILKQYDEAILVFKRAIELKPSDYVANNNIAFFAYSHTEEYDKALTHITIAIERSKPQAAFFDTRAQVYWLKGDYDKALADFEVASELDNRGLTLAGQAVTYFAKGDEGKAIELWNQAIELDDTLADPTVFEKEYHYTPAYVKAIERLLDKSHGSEE